MTKKMDIEKIRDTAIQKTQDETSAFIVDIPEKMKQL